MDAPLMPVIAICPLPELKVIGSVVVVPDGIALLILTITRPLKLLVRHLWFRNVKSTLVEVTLTPLDSILGMPLIFAIK